LLHHEIVHVAGVRAFRILQAVFLRFRIEMCPSSFEGWTFTLGKLVEVDGVWTRRKVFQVQLDSYALAGRRQSGGTNRLTLSVLQFNFVCGMLRSDKRQQASDDNAGDDPCDKVLLQLYPPCSNS